MTAVAPQALPPHRGSLAPTGLMLAAISLLAVFVLMHHPLSQGHDGAEALASIRAQSLTDQIVHGALAAIMGLLEVAMLLFASRLGVWRFPVMLGVVAFSAASVLLVLAVLADGFAVPTLAAGCGPASPSACAAQTIPLIRLCAIAIEYLTRFALVATAIAIVSWSFALLRTPRAPRWAGLAGLAVGLLQAAALIGTPERLTPQNFLLVLSAQMLWHLVAAALFISGRGPFGKEAA